MKKKNPLAEDKFPPTKATLGGGFVGHPNYLKVSLRDRDHSLAREWDSGFRLCRTTRNDK